MNTRVYFDLIDRILQLDSHIIQLKNVIKKSGENRKSGASQTSAKSFNFSQKSKRHILLKFYYLGWNYKGFVEQEDTINTVEHHIFEALKKSCLIENRESSNYHRCGRTDKGVSAHSQVISLDVRSVLKTDDQHKVNDELPYSKILNRILPDSIKCIAWASVGSDYSARFDCKHRTYKYFFPRGNLNIEAMRKAASLLIGLHDFRNICKMDVANGVVNFKRTIVDAQIICSNNDQSITAGYDMCFLIIKSKAFLWHQIRCIMGILFLVGQGREKSDIFSHLLNVEKCPRKPQYSLAHELPLNLFHCDYDDVDWFYDDQELHVVIKKLQEDWTMNSIKSAMTRSMLQNLENLTKNKISSNNQSDCLILGVHSKCYQPLMKRITCESLENRIKHFEKKQRINIKNVLKENE
ncbi:tRNA pseudouridine(38/39) synthase isoform X2 [Aphidius gifuensis]|uniref:tRNA pseudouridine(38/39) synthase isoform X2 n=1 Tax=Aphidius gifuensis TaxID=684658 RepID=UPI001CDCED08|nr:tRNA pseudouridine(38/39) synthase isoform X2 [Aphidius gifuensis]